MGGEGVNKLGVDQIGQGCRVGLFADVPGLQPREFGVRRSRTRIGHFGQTQIDRVGENHGQELGTIRGALAGFDMREMAREAGPRIDFHEQLGDLDAR